MNEFTQQESLLVRRIVKWLQQNPLISEDKRKGMILHFACGWVRTYARPDDYNAAVTAVVELVNAQWYLPCYGAKT
jgi:hypothetical protein